MPHTQTTACGCETGPRHQEIHGNTRRQETNWRARETERGRKCVQHQPKQKQSATIIIEKMAVPLLDLGKLKNIERQLYNLVMRHPEHAKSMDLV